MFNLRPVSATLLTLSVLCLPLASRADTLIFDLSPTNNVTLRGAGSGPAQGVMVSTTTTISSFAFYVATPSAENVKFFIDDATGADVLYSQVLATAANASFGWLQSGPLYFTLNAGSEYFFGIVGDGARTQIGYILPTFAYSANGLAADSTGNRNTTSFATPRLDPGAGSTEIGLQLFQSTAVTVTPEPNSLILLGTGALGMLGVVRRRLMSI